MLIGGIGGGGGGIGGRGGGKGGIGGGGGGIGGIIQFLSRSLSLAKRNSYVHGFQAAFIGHQVPHCVGAMPLGKGQRLQFNAAFFRKPQQPIATMALGYNLLDRLISCPRYGRLASIKGFEVLFEGFHIVWVLEGFEL